MKWASGVDGVVNGVGGRANVDRYIFASLLSVQVDGGDLRRPSELFLAATALERG